MHTQGQLQIGLDPCARLHWPSPAASQAVRGGMPGTDRFQQAGSTCWEARPLDSAFLSACLTLTEELSFSHTHPKAASKLLCRFLCPMRMSLYFMGFCIRIPGPLSQRLRKWLGSPGSGSAEAVGEQCSRGTEAPWAWVQGCYPLATL